MGKIMGTIQTIKRSLLAMCALTLVACGSEVEFSSITSYSITSLGDDRFQVTEAFDINKSSSRKVDIIWIIDNSGSMTAEAAHVRANYLEFTNGLIGQADIKSVLISDEGTDGNKVRMPDELRGDSHMQVDRYVHSRDAMCIAQATLFTQQEHLDKTSSGGCAERFGHATPTLGLMEFLRPTSQKVFIFVTDDNEGFTTSNSFLNDFRSTFNQDPLVYGFIGLGAQSPCQARTGNVYKDAVQATGGAFYNICDTDWSQHFAQLTNHVSQSVKSTFSLSFPDIENDDITVTVDGRVLDASEYTLDSGLLRIDETVLLNATGQVVVTYVTVIEEESIDP